MHAIAVNVSTRTTHFAILVYLAGTSPLCGARYADVAGTPHNVGTAVPTHAECTSQLCHPRVVILLCRIYTMRLRNIPKHFEDMASRKYALLLRCTLCARCTGDIQMGHVTIVRRNDRRVVDAVHTRSAWHRSARILHEPFC